MGWHGDSNAQCPNCNGKNAAEMFRSSMLESYYLACPDCGLCLHAEYRQWIVTNTYIDKSIVGKDPKELMPDEFVDENKNENIIQKGTAL